MRRLLTGMLAVVTAVTLASCSLTAPLKPGEPQWRDGAGVIKGSMVECKLVNTTAAAISARIENLANSEIRVRGEIEVTLTETSNLKTVNKQTFEYRLPARKTQVTGRVIPPPVGSKWKAVTCRLDDLQVKAGG